MLEIGATIAGDYLGYKADAVEGSLLKGDRVDRLFGRNSMIIHIEEGSGQKFGIDKALAVGLSGSNLRDKSIGDSLASLIMFGIFLHNLRVAAPILHNLTGEFDKVARHRGTCQGRIVALAKETVKGMAKLVEEGLTLIEIEERRFVGGRLCEVADDLNDRDNVVTLAVDALTTELGHPSTATLACAGEEIHIEDTDDLTIFKHLVGMSLSIVVGQLGILAESESIKFISHGESALTHIVEGEIGADGIVIEVIFGLAQLFAIETPIPRLEFSARDILCDKFLIIGAFVLSLGQSRVPYLHKTIIDGFWGLGDAIIENIGGMGREAEDVGTFETEIDEGVDDFGVVVLTTVASRRISIPDLLTEVAIGAIGQEGFPRRHLQGEDILALGGLIGIGSFAGSCYLVRRKTLELSAIEDQGIVVGSLEDILSEAEREAGDLLVELTESGLLVGRHVGTIADETLIGLVEEAGLLGVEAEAGTIVVDSLDASKEFVVEGDIVAVCGEERGHFLGDSLHFGAVLALAQVEEDAADGAKKLAAVLVSLDGIGEGRGIAIVDDSLNLGLLLFHALLESRHIMFGLDAGEIGDLVGCVPSAKKWVVHVLVVFAASQHDDSGKSCDGDFFVNHNK